MGGTCFEVEKYSDKINLTKYVHKNINNQIIRLLTRASRRN